EGAPGGIVEEARIVDVGAEGTVVGEVAVLQGQRGVHPVLNRPAGAAAHVGRACASRYHVVRQRTTDDGGRAAQVVEGAAEVVEAHARQGRVVAQGAAGHAQGGTIRIEDGAAASAAPALVEAHRRAGTVVRQQAAGDAQAGVGVVEEGAAADAAVGMVVGQGDAGQGQADADLVQDATAVVGHSVSDRQAGEADGLVVADVEDPADTVAADGQQAGARPLDAQ